ncbi:hypothetical protein DKP78_18485, partial [Enterococcus faecium]
PDKVSKTWWLPCSPQGSAQHQDYLAYTLAPEPPNNGPIKGLVSRQWFSKFSHMDQAGLLFWDKDTICLLACQPNGLE